MKIIGITGSSGSGKSTVCEILNEKYNVKIIDADKIAKELLTSGTEYFNDVISKFGREITDDVGKIDRKKLADLIYNDDKKREMLNNSTFYYVVKEIKLRAKEANNVDIIIDAPLLFESKLDDICNFTIGVIAKESVQIERIIKRDSISKEQACKRIKAQQTNDFYMSKCTEIIENNNEYIETEKQIEEIAKKYNITKKLQ